MLVFVGNPTQYHSPLFRALEDSGELEVEVLFGEEIGAKPFYNPEVAAVIDWDVPVLDGYPHRFFANLSSSDGKGFWSRNNPAMIPYVWRSKAPYVLIHGYSTLSAWYVYFAALLSGKKIIWRGETIEPKGGARGLTSLVKSLVLPIYFRGCHKVLYSCLANKAYLTKYLRGQTQKLVSFPCAVDNAFFAAHRIEDPAARAAVRAQYGPPDDHLVIATCSRLTKRKRTDVIIKAMARMRSKKVSLLVIGDGPERESLSELAERLRVHVVFAGFVGQRTVARLLSVADVFALLSAYDASPKALNEAMNFPIPMVVSDGVGTSLDLVHHGVNGYIFRDGDEMALVDYFNGFAEDAEARIAMGRYNAGIIAQYALDVDVRNLIEALPKA
jgi:glycosyltransferase involved in cell wall biosynthesis